MILTKNHQYRAGRSRSSFTPAPNVNLGTNECVWRDFVVKYDNTKGWGVYAKRNLTAGLCFPYGGVIVTAQQASNLIKSCTRVFSDGSRNTKTDYLLHNPNNNTYLDAHPSMYQSEWPKYSWLGSLVNEPNLTETANAIIRCDITEDPTIRTKGSTMEIKHFQYPNIIPNNTTFMQLAVDVEKGEEIMVVYGYSKTAHKRLGYEVGAGCFEQTSMMVSSSAAITNLIPAQYGINKNRSAKQTKHAIRNIKIINKRRKEEASSCMRTKKAIK